MNPATGHEGVKWQPNQRLDVFFMTLNKVDKEYSPIGQRHIHHRTQGIRILLFVREFKTDRISGSAVTYTYFGTASYVCHERSRQVILHENRADRSRQSF